MQIITKELSEIRLQGTQHEQPDKPTVNFNTTQLLNHPYITGKVKNTTQIYAWVKENNGYITYNWSRKNVDRVSVNEQ